VRIVVSKSCTFSDSNVLAHERLTPGTQRREV